MTNALVLLEACTACNRVQRVYLARPSRRKTPLLCPECARPWIEWTCDECGSGNFQQVDALPKEDFISATCAHCSASLESVRWAASSPENALQSRLSPSGGKAAQSNRR